MQRPSSQARLPTLGRRGEGWFAAQVALMAVVGVAGALGPAWHGPAEAATAIAGLALIVAGAIVGGRALLDLRASFTPLPRPVEGGEMVDRGVYGVVRHPMYLAVVVGGLGWSLLTASPASALATVALFGFFDLKSRREEAWLVEAYPAYEAYRHRTRRILPAVY